jgi:hypothetical protein
MTQPSTRTRPSLPAQSSPEFADRPAGRRAAPRGRVGVLWRGFRQAALVTLATALPGALLAGVLISAKPLEADPQVWTPSYANGQVGPVLLRGLELVQEPAGSTPAGHPDAGADVALVGALLNDGPAEDVLVEARAGSAVAGGLGIVLTPDRLVGLGGAGNPAVRLPGLADGAQLGTFVDLTLTFRNAGTVTLPVLFRR